MDSYHTISNLYFFFFSSLKDVWQNPKKHLEHLEDIDKQAWIRKQSVMTQTVPSEIGYNIPYFKSNSTEDPDLLEVLSLYEGVADAYDSIEEDANDSEKKNEKITSSFGSGSSCSSKEHADLDDDNEEVILRNNNNMLCGFGNSQMPLRYTTSVPISLSSKYSCNSVNRSDNKLCNENLLRREAFGSFDRKYIKDSISRRPFGLQLNNETYQNIGELPSPSSASLHSGHGHIGMQDMLTTKSNSAPILLKKEKRRDDFAAQTMVIF